MSFGSPPKAPSGSAGTAAPAPPPPPPTPAQPSVIQQGWAEQMRLSAAGGQGFGGTNVTGGQGAAAPDTTKSVTTKSVLGG